MTQENNDKKKSIAPLLAPRGSGPDSSSRGGGEGMDRKIKKKLWTPGRIGMLIGGVAFIALLGWGFSTTTGGRRLNVDMERITIAEVELMPFQESVSSTGAVEPETTVYLDATEGGRIEEIFVLAGEDVVQGDPLLRLTNPNLQLQVLQAEQSRIEQVNRLEQTRLQIENNSLNVRQQLVSMDYNIKRLQRVYEQNKALHERGLISDQEFEIARDNYEEQVTRRDLTQRQFRADSIRQKVQIENMEVSIEQMDRNFNFVQERLANLVVRAPVSGQLSQFNAELGQQVGSGFRFGQIDMTEGVKVVAQIDEFHINRVQVGQRAFTTTPIGGQNYEMVVRRVYPEVSGGRFEVDLDFVGEDPAEARRGLTVRFRLEMSDPIDAVVIPQGGFFQETGGNWIYVVDPSGDFATKRFIRIGRKNLEVYEVNEGLEPGERVVTSSYDTFNEADRLVFK